MSTIFDKDKLDFNCPNCGNKLSETVGRLNSGGYTCPSCGTVFDTTGLRREAEKADRMTKDFLRKLGGR